LSNASTAPEATFESDFLNTLLAFTFASDCSMGLASAAVAPLPLLPLLALAPLLLTSAIAPDSSAVKGGLGLRARLFLLMPSCLLLRSKLGTAVLGDCSTSIKAEGFPARLGLIRCLFR
jgi:hypothetical protein